MFSFTKKAKSHSREGVRCLTSYHIISYLLHNDNDDDGQGRRRRKSAKTRDRRMKSIAKIY